MFETIRAEWRKTGSNRWATGLALWVFPAGAVGIFAFVLLIVGLGLDSGRMQVDDVRWTDQMILAWQLPLGNLFGYLLLAAFAATIFAGESTWNTWKSIVPRQARSRLILAKYTVAAGFLLIAFLLTSLIAGLGSVLLAAVTGAPVLPAIDGDSLIAFVSLFFRSVPMSFLALMLILSYAMVAAIITRSVVFGVIGGAALATLDFGSGSLLMLASRFLDSPGVLRLNQIIPSYNLANLRAWVVDGSPQLISAADGTTFVNSEIASLLLVALWLGGLLLLTILVFQRRDLT